MHYPLLSLHAGFTLLSPRKTLADALSGARAGGSLPRGEVGLADLSATA
ncbi:MAG: hypothetical protein H0W17_08225 [Chloroflexi bacterium]|nr:hypothetical protein [Chloroflexota bacterium]HEV8053535.1 hypothetical protein [Candidatus Limnocylindrales bacterium]